MKRYYTLDGLRGIAASTVAAGHCAMALGTPIPRGSTALAVDFFFMLSGFVLLHAYGERLRTREELKPYIIARIIRLYPLIVLSTGVASICICLIANEPDAPLMVHTLEGMLLIPAVPARDWGSLIMPLNPPAWSLFFETIASVALGLGLWRRPFEPVTTTIASIILVVSVILLGGINFGFTYATIWVGFARVFFGFGVGAALFRRRNIMVVPSLPFPVLGALLACLLLVPGHRIYILLCLFILLPLALVFGSQSEGQYSWLSHWSGELSYPIYLMHWPVVLMVRFSVNKLGFESSGFLVFAATLMTSVGVAWSALVAYDRPIRAWLTRIYNEHHPRAAVEERIAAP